MPSEEAKVPRVQVELYSLNEGSWRITTSGSDSFPPWLKGAWAKPVACFKGAIHFAMKHRDNVLVLSFDLGDEVFRVSTPQDIIRGSDQMTTSQEQESRQNRSVGDGVEKPRYNGDLVSGEKGLYTYAGVVGIKTPMKIVKQLESEPLVPPVSESDRGSIAVLATESYFQTIPKIPAKSKIRHPLRCFSKSKSS
ncbi:F-box/kelch-repeat protein At3g23880-like isoform X5 [Fagus crenata]